MTDLTARDAVPPRPRREFSRRWMGLGALGLLLLVGAAAGFYGTLPSLSNANACPASARETAARIAPLAKGEVAALQVRPNPGTLPDLAFKAPDGAPLTLASLKGKTVLLNLWATWCAPCRKEMPALDALQGEFGDKGFEVVAITIDQGGMEKPNKFLDEIGVKRLARYADPTARVFTDLKGVGKAFGMPTTILIDPNGCELANLAGPAEWASADAFAVIRAALGK